MNMTKTQAMILDHRLTVPDAIVDAMTDVEEPEFTDEEIVDSISRLEIMVKQRRFDLPMTKCDLEVLYDLIDGNTYFACMSDGVDDGAIPERMYKRHYIQAEEIERFAYWATGKTVFFPTR